MLKLIDGYVNEQCAVQSIQRGEFFFSRRALREAIIWGDTQLKIHLARLAELEYLVTHRTKNNGFEYELVYDIAGSNDSLRFPCLADIEALRCAYDGARSGQKVAWSGSSRGAVAPRSVAGRGNESPAKPLSITVTADVEDDATKNHCQR